MVSLEDDERTLVDGLTACLAIALRRSDRYDVDDVGETVAQKLVFLAAKEFDCELTYSWYLAGSYVDGGTDGAARVATAFDSLPQPPSPADPGGPSPDVASESEDVDEELTDVEREFQLEQSIDDSFSSEPATPSESKRTPSDEQWKPWLHAAAEQVVPADFDRPVEDVVAFYERVLRQYPVHPTDRFLHQFYQYHTPPEFANLYENNLQLRSVLHSVVTDIEAALQDSPQQADFERHREEFGRHLSEFHLELFGTESLAATGEAVVRATEPIEEMLIALAAMNATDLTAEHKTVAEEVRDFFYYVVWRYPALNVSIETAQGPNADELIDERRETFESFESTVTERTAEIEARLTEVGLVPGVDDYPDRGDGVLDDTIGDFLSVYQNRSG